MKPHFPVQYNGQLYDIQNFLADHPGGVNTLKKYYGKSVTKAMAGFGHSPSAYHILADFKKASSDVNLTGEVSASGRVITKEEFASDKKDIAFLEELEARLDWSKPLVSQLGAIAPHYQLWVNSAVCRSCRLFSSPVLERLSYTPWYVVPIFWLPIICYLGVSQFIENVAYAESDKTKLTVTQYCGYLAFGFILWSVLEYTLHRWIFHFDPGSSLTMIKLHFLIHGLHHKMPFDELRQVFPPLPALLLASVLYVPFWLFTSHPRIILTAALTGYLIYDMIHFYVHHGSPRPGSYLYAMKRYHSNHHFLNHDRAFGISSKFWDLIFNTFVRVKKLSFNLHW